MSLLSHVRSCLLAPQLQWEKDSGTCSPVQHPAKQKNIHVGTRLALRGGPETRTVLFPEGAQAGQVCPQRPASAGGSHQESADHVSPLVQEQSCRCGCRLGRAHRFHSTVCKQPQPPGLYQPVLSQGGSLSSFWPFLFSSPLPSLLLIFPCGLCFSTRPVLNPLSLHLCYCSHWPSCLGLQ